VFVRMRAQCFSKTKTFGIGMLEQVRSRNSQVKTQLILWIFILFKVTR